MADTPDRPSDLGRGTGQGGRTGGAPFHPDIPRRVIDIPARGASRPAAPPGTEASSSTPQQAVPETANRQRRRLHVGAEITLSGEIS